MDFQFDSYTSTDSPNSTIPFIPTLNRNTYTPVKYVNQSNLTSTLVASTWGDNFTTPAPKLLEFMNGDIVEIKNKNHKYGHTATYYNGKWYSDFGLQTMDPYKDKHNSSYRIFRNPNRQEAEQAAALTALRASTKSRGRCALAVREGLNLISKGKYNGEGYNGNNFGDYLSKRGFTLIAKRGMKFQEGGLFNTYSSVKAPAAKDYSEFLNPYHNRTMFETFTPKTYVAEDTKLQTTSWGNNFEEIINNLTKPKPMNNINTVIDKIVKGGYATDPNYGNYLLKMIKSVLNAKGSNKAFTDRRFNSYKSRGLDDNTALVLTAQDAWESAWGKKTSGKNNYGGIKGKGSSVTTHEYINGKRVKMNLSFADYNSEDEYTDAKLDLLKRKYDIG